MLNKKILKLLGVAYHDLASITIFADGSGHIDDDAMDFEFVENKKCFAFKNVAELEAHLTMLAPRQGAGGGRER